MERALSSADCRRILIFSGALELEQFEPSWLFASGVASFLSEFSDLILPRNRDRVENLPERWKSFEQYYRKRVSS